MGNEGPSFTFTASEIDSPSAGSIPDLYSLVASKPQGALSVQVHCVQRTPEGKGGCKSEPPNPC